MHKLSICAVVKNEAPYLEEWLCYHIIKGVEHFYLYDNGSVDGTIEILNRYKRLGFVTWETLLDIPIQLVAYNRCIEDYKEQTIWCAFIDVDEFIACKPFIPDILHNFSSDVSVVAIHWVLFGSNFKSHKREGLVTERFTRRAKLPNKHVKSIVKMEDVISTNRNPHCFKTIQKIQNEAGEILVYPSDQYALLSNPSANIIWLNHYHTKSYAEYIQRKTFYPTSADGLVRTRENIDQMFKDHDSNEIEDLRMLEYAPRIKEAIEARRYS